MDVVPTSELALLAAAAMRQLRVDVEPRLLPDVIALLQTMADASAQLEKVLHSAQGGSERVDPGL